MAEGKRLRLGLLGVGRRGQGHLSAIAGLGDRYELVAICDLDQTRLRSATQRFSVRTYSDIREFFSREHLDVVDIVTPAESHHMMAKVAAEHGVHMLIETPLAPTRAMMDFIAEAAEEARVQVEVGENFWRQPEARLNRKVLDAGLVGRVLRLSSFYEPIGQQGCYHSMSLLRFYANCGVEEVRGFSQRFAVAPVKSYSGELDAENWVQALLFFSNGILGSCTYLSSWLTPLRWGHPHFLTVEGSAGFITDGRRGAPTIHRLEGGTQITSPLKIDTQREREREIPVRFYYETSPVVDYANPFADRPLDYGDNWGAADIIAIADELASIHRAVVAQEAADYGISKARLDQELSIAISESARLEGRAVRLPLGGETAWEREQHEAFRVKWGGDPFKDADRLITRNFSPR